MIHTPQARRGGPSVTRRGSRLGDKKLFDAMQEGYHEAPSEALVAPVGTSNKDDPDYKPWLDPERDPTILCSKTPNIIYLEEEIERTQEKIESAKDDEEKLRKEFQVHRQHNDDVLAYMAKRKFEMIGPLSATSNLLTNAIPNTDWHMRQQVKKRKRHMRKMQMMLRADHRYEDMHLIFLAFKLNADLRIMQKHMEHEIHELNARVRKKEELYQSLDQLVAEKTALQVRLKEKCRQVAWAKVKTWGVAKDVFTKKGFYSWKSAMPILKVCNDTEGPQQAYDDLMDSFKEALQETVDLEKERDECITKRDDALAALHAVEEKIEEAVAQQKYDIAKSRAEFQDNVDMREKEFFENCEKTDTEQHERKERLRTELTERQEELERLLREMEQRLGKKLARRVVPQNKGVRCMGCKKQLLFRDLTVVSGEHEYPEWDNVIAHQGMKDGEGSPICKAVNHLIDDNPKFRLRSALGRFDIGPKIIHEGRFVDPRLNRSWADGVGRLDDALERDEQKLRILKEEAGIDPDDNGTDNERYMTPEQLRRNRWKHIGDSGFDLRKKDPVFVGLRRDQRTEVDMATYTPTVKVYHKAKSWDEAEFYRGEVDEESVDTVEEPATRPGTSGEIGLRRADPTRSASAEFGVVAPFPIAGSIPARGAEEGGAGSGEADAKNRSKTTTIEGERPSSQQGQMAFGKSWTEKSGRIESTKEQKGGDKKSKTSQKGGSSSSSWKDTALFASTVRNSANENFRANAGSPYAKGFKETTRPKSREDVRRPKVRQESFPDYPGWRDSNEIHGKPKTRPRSVSPELMEKAFNSTGESAFKSTMGFNRSVSKDQYDSNGFDEPTMRRGKKDRGKDTTDGWKDAHQQGRAQDRTSSPDSSPNAKSKMYMKLRKVDDFLNRKRRKEQQDSREAYLHLRTKKHEPKQFMQPLMDETWGRDPTHLRDFKEKMGKKGWR